MGPINLVTKVDFDLRERGEGGGGGEERRKVHMPDSGVSKQLHGRHLLRCINTVKGSDKGDLFGP